ncbi:MAG: hypothetical protein ACRDTH_06515 [Pseudonocardiaceae bacterium]
MTARTVAVLNDYDIRVVKTKGEFTRHSHPDTDKCFLVGIVQTVATLAVELALAVLAGRGLRRFPPPFDTLRQQDCDR